MRRTSCISTLLLGALCALGCVAEPGDERAARELQVDVSGDGLVFGAEECEWEEALDCTPCGEWAVCGDGEVFRGLRQLRMWWG